MKCISAMTLAFLLTPVPAFAAKYFLYAGSYTAGTSKGIYAWSFDSTDGKISPLGLMAQTPQAAHVWIAPNGKTLYTVNWENEGGVSAYRIDQKTGAQLWSHPTTMTFYFAPVIGGQTVLLSSGAQLVALDTVSGRQRWTTSMPGEDVIPSAVQGSRVFVKSTSTLYALDLASGKQLWQVHDLNYISLPAVAGDQVFVINGMGVSTSLSALNSSPGRTGRGQRKSVKPAPMIPPAGFTSLSTSSRPLCVCTIP